MSDIFSPEQRSQIMSKIRSGGNRSTELILVKQFRASGITGWRRGFNLFGRPDFVFPNELVSVFVDGCFWHACPKHTSLPATNELFWLQKLWSNQERDRSVSSRLRACGWRVVRIWEHDLQQRNIHLAIARIRRVLSEQRVKQLSERGQC